MLSTTSISLSMLPPRCQLSDLRYREQEDGTGATSIIDCDILQPSRQFNTVFLDGKGLAFPNKIRWGVFAQGMKNHRQFVLYLIVFTSKATPMEWVTRRDVSEKCVVVMKCFIIQIRRRKHLLVDVLSGFRYLTRTYEFFWWFAKGNNSLTDMIRRMPRSPSLPEVRYGHWIRMKRGDRVSFHY